MGSSEVQGLFRIESGVNAAEHDPRATLARHLSNLIAPEGIARMNADANYIAGCNARWV
jgi:hypothetical protein